jgi:PTH1 family peptidyl-tRNA hydrolase
VRDLLVFGLGNPGREYAHTRHNLGAMCVEDLAKRLGTALDRRRWHSRVGYAELSVDVPDDQRLVRIWLAFPQTYMNDSGRAAAAALRDLRLPLDSLWVVYDELDLPFCRLRIRRRGSAAGHNGLRSLIAQLHSQEFPRFRVGVGRPQHPEQDPIDHLLSPFTRSEAAQLETMVSGVAQAIEDAIRLGFDRAMDVYNRAGSLGCLQ